MLVVVRVVSVVVPVVFVAWVVVLLLVEWVAAPGDGGHVGALQQADAARGLVSGRDGRVGPLHGSGLLATDGLPTAEDRGAIEGLDRGATDGLDTGAMDGLLPVEARGFTEGLEGGMEDLEGGMEGLEGGMEGLATG